jgi:hypothetical protein
MPVPFPAEFALFSGRPENIFAVDKPFWQNQVTFLRKGH